MGTSWVSVPGVGGAAGEFPPVFPQVPSSTPSTPYQFFKTRVVMSAAMTMMRDTVMVTIWCTARPAGGGGQVSLTGTHKQMVP